MSILAEEETLFARMFHDIPRKTSLDCAQVRCSTDIIETH